MKSIIPLSFLRKRAREQKDKEQQEAQCQAAHPDPTVHDNLRKKFRYDKYSK